jgi:hypothetical protein
VDDYRYIDIKGILHENMMHFIDESGRMHETPMHYMTEYKTIYDEINYEKNIEDANDKHKCYQSISPHRKHPYWKHARKYSKNRKLSYIATMAENDLISDSNEADEISRLQKQLSNQITKSV